tara:strand:- start:843 stop:1109 length:267 start_codon:yes stop_codon:yes gene_type:complete
MEKFIILNSTGAQFIVSADIYDVSRSGANLRVSYLDKQIGISNASGSTAGADVIAFNDAVKKVWSQGYTEPSITIDLPSGAVNEIAAV